MKKTDIEKIADAVSEKLSKDSDAVRKNIGLKDIIESHFDFMLNDYNRYRREILEMQKMGFTYQLALKTEIALFIEGYIQSLSNSGGEDYGLCVRYRVDPETGEYSSEREESGEEEGVKK